MSIIELTTKTKRDTDWANYLHAINIISRIYELFIDHPEVFFILQMEDINIPRLMDAAGDYSK